MQNNRTNTSFGGYNIFQLFTKNNYEELSVEYGSEILVELVYKEENFKPKSKDMPITILQKDFANYEYKVNINNMQLITSLGECPRIIRAIYIVMIDVPEMRLIFKKLNDNFERCCVYKKT